MQQFILLTIQFDIYCFKFVNLFSLKLKNDFIIKYHNTLILTKNNTMSTEINPVTANVEIGRRNDVNKKSVRYVKLTNKLCIHNKCKFTEGLNVEVGLTRRSIVILQKNARYKWRHSIDARKMDNGVKRGKRVSITFREAVKM
jgi:hypothetical protein